MSSGDSIENAREKLRDHRRVRDFGVVGEAIVHRQADGEFVSVTVVDRAAFRTGFANTLLLALRFRKILAIAEQLQVSYAGENRAHPNNGQKKNYEPTDAGRTLIHGSGNSGLFERNFRAA